MWIHAPVVEGCSGGECWLETLVSSAIWSPHSSAMYLSPQLCASRTVSSGGYTQKHTPSDWCFASRYIKTIHASEVSPVFPLREPSTEQLLKIFRGNSIKNYPDEQRLWLNWKRAHLSQVLCVINYMGVFVYTSELGVNKCASSASVVGFEVEGVRWSGWGLQQGFVLSYLWICVIAELTYRKSVLPPFCRAALQACVPVMDS